MISNVTISLLLGFADCAKMQQLDNLRIGAVTTNTYMIVPVATIIS